MIVLPGITALPTCFCSAHIKHLTNVVRQPWRCSLLPRSSFLQHAWLIVVLVGALHRVFPAPLPGAAREEWEWVGEAVLLSATSRSKIDISKEPGFLIFLKEECKCGYRLHSDSFCDRFQGCRVLSVLFLPTPKGLSGVLSHASGWADETVESIEDVRFSSEVDSVPICISSELTFCSNKNPATKPKEVKRFRALCEFLCLFCFWLVLFPVFFSCSLFFYSSNVFV